MNSSLHFNPTLKLPPNCPTTSHCLTFRTSLSGHSSSRGFPAADQYKLPSHHSLFKKGGHTGGLKPDENTPGPQWVTV